jgi:hypothetical protein
MGCYFIVLAQHKLQFEDMAVVAIRAFRIPESEKNNGYNLLLRLDRLLFRRRRRGRVTIMRAVSIQPERLRGGGKIVEELFFIEPSCYVRALIA